MPDPFLDRGRVERDADDGRAPLADALGRVLWHLRPYLPDIVVIGGWVPYLFQRYGPFPTWSGRLSLTSEADLLVPQELPPRDRPPIATLLREAGFAPVLNTGAVGASQAVWANDPARGEKVEFLVPHTGTGRDVGRVIPVGDQREVGAIALTSLDVLQRHTQTLAVLAMAPDGGRHVVTVRVPRLGAYVLNKAATFLRRQPAADGGGNPKQAKDLLYLRDLMHGGSEVAAAIERDLDEIRAADPFTQGIIDSAANTLDGATRVGTSTADARLAAVASMLVEREPEWSHAAAVADVAGHLTDLAGILLDRRSPPPAPDDTWEH